MQELCGRAGVARTLLPFSRPRRRMSFRSDRYDSVGMIHVATRCFASMHQAFCELLWLGAACVEAAVGGTCLIPTHGRARRIRDSVRERHLVARRPSAAD